MDRLRSVSAERERANTPLRANRSPSSNVGPREDIRELEVHGRQEGGRLLMAGVGLMTMIGIVTLIMWASNRRAFAPVFPDTYTDAHGRILKHHRNGL